MANWISSKLRAAESILQQIDQQAAESLGKSEKSTPNEALNQEAPPRSEAIPLKDQLKKKSLQKKPPVANARSNYDPGGPARPKDSDGAWRSVSIPLPAPADGDWTELLGSSKVPSPAVQLNAAPEPRKDPRRAGTVGASDRRRSVSKSGRKSEAEAEKKAISDGSGGDRKKNDPQSVLSTSLSADGSQLSGPIESSESKEAENVVPFGGRKAVAGSRDVEIVEIEENGRDSHSEINGGDAGEITGDNIPSVSASVHEGSELSGRSVGEVGEIGNSVARGGSDVAAGNHFPVRPLMHSPSSGESDSDSDSGSTSSDSENEKERRIERRKRRERILAERAAARAAEAIKERENVVARLEGEKESLEKILDEREKQKVQEASELQTNMMQKMQAVELEKQKHNSTRMEALARLAKLETTNAELARSLATTQWNLEVQVDRVAELRQRIEFKEAAHAELRRRRSTIQQSKSLSQLEVSKGVEFEREILQAEYSFMCDKVQKMHQKAKDLEENIETTRNGMEHPTEVEIELKKRLAMLTDLLIQKQAQVEVLSSEKATLLFRLETVSRLLDESKSSLHLVDLAGPSAREDIESGMREEQPKLRLKPALQNRIQSGSQHLGSILRQLDAIFSAGSVFLKRSPAAQKWSLVYLVCLHIWVIYTLMSYSQPSDNTSSGVVISLESINKTSGT